jgi:hypothetical protein
MTTEKRVSAGGSGNDKSKPLNEQNWTGLLAISALNLIVFAAVAAIDPTPFSRLATAWAFLLPAGVGLAMIRVVNGLFDGATKDRLVFWKWQHPLPASEAFTVHAKSDERFSEAEVCKKFAVTDAIKRDPKKQNAHWYKAVYFPVQDMPSVQQAHRNFLFTRDYAAISFVMLVALGVGGFFVMAPVSRWLLYCAGLGLQYLLVRWAARNYGIEMVKDALAAGFARE